MIRLQQLALVAVATTCLACMAGARPSLAPFYRAEDRLLDDYIIVLNDDVDVSAVSSQMTSQAQTENVSFRVNRLFSTVLKGLHVFMSSRALSFVRAHSAVKYVEENGMVYTTETWGLDRIDQRSLPLDDKFSPYQGDGKGVSIYVIDTGIRTTHEEFEDRATFAYDAVEGAVGNGTDCRGHGTHCAGTAAGLRYGVAKKAMVYGVRVLGCQGSGTWSSVIKGMDWVAQHGIRPAVASMSLGGGGSRSVDESVASLYAQGVTVVVAAGNNGYEACRRSPARAPEAITVGATEDDDSRAYFSNYGGCVDIFAPGRYITAAYNEGDDDYNTISGTSMATPHVAGAAALLLSVDPMLTPADITNRLLNSATRDKISDARDSPNLLLFTP
ncbi:aqualysin-1-like [Patiria miniata]|uniref:Peptidase S8/S53 domain-containing protein n=1 Tax=Patiria miniata TaxID=46514 RepID=A0A914B5P7_PATMI|nr:aqualysin-1-like [Patiria miniata]XP_038071265.1 aqualysin-1-like [Patiria miniata]